MMNFVLEYPPTKGIRGLIMKGYILDYVNENEYHKLERALKKYNMLAYKELVFKDYPELRNGNFLGKIVSENKIEKTKSYELELPTDELFQKVHGKVRLHYTIYEEKKVVLLTNITPDDILEEGHRAELTTYKGVMISKSNPKKDIFKVNLLNMLNK